MIRSKPQMRKVLDKISDEPGLVLFTLVDPELRGMVEECCKSRNMPCVSVLDPVIQGLSSYLGESGKNIPGLQHTMDESYFRRVEAIDFALAYDDGQNLAGLAQADVILVGVSRTSKTPTCIYLARLGIKAANVPIVPGDGTLQKLKAIEGPLFVGLTESPETLVALRRKRLHLETNAQWHVAPDYVDLEKVTEEVRMARRLFSERGWPVIDVTRRAVEETAAEIVFLLQKDESAKVAAR